MDGIDHEYTGEIVCPYCGYEFSDSWEISGNDGSLVCEECGKKFRYERHVSIMYSTSKAVW